MADEKPVYVQINRKIWNTIQFRDLSRDARELFFYLTTCPHGNMIGCFVLRPGYALDDLQWGTDRERFMEPFRELLAQHLFKYDPKTEIVLDMEQIEKHPPINPNQVTAAIKIINSLPKTLLFQDLKLLAESLGKPFLEPFVKRLAERYAYPETESVTESETEAEEGSVRGEEPQPPNPPSEKKDGNGDGKNHIKEMASLVDKIREKYQDARYNRDVMMFIESNIKVAHPGAIIHCLRSLLDNPKTVQAPRPYLEAALKIENGKHNARDHEVASAEFKKPGMASFSQIVAEIERRRE